MGANMSKLSLSTMKNYLSRSISSLNRNKLNGLLAEIDFREHIQRLNIENRVSPGGWIVRNIGEGIFGHRTTVMFPEIINIDTDYNESTFSEPPRGLHTICSTMHQIGIQSYYCVPVINECNNPESIEWFSTQLGIPEERPYINLINNLRGFSKERERNYNYLRYETNTSEIPESYIAEEFTKENLRVSFCSHYQTEISDIDGIFWGQQYTYPLEIKEKTAANDSKLGKYFGLDIGPFVKLAFYAAKKGNLHSLFIVKEIDNIAERNLIQWWFITFDCLAQYASWISIGGGTNMQGGGSTVVKIPKAEFKQLDINNISLL